MTISIEVINGLVELGVLPAGPYTHETRMQQILQIGRRLSQLIATVEERVREARECDCPKCQLRKLREDTMRDYECNSESAPAA